MSLAPGGQLAEVVATALGDHGAAFAPKVIAAIDGLDWEIRSSVRARAERSNSRHRAVRFSGSLVVDRIISTSERRFFRAVSSFRYDIASR